MTTPTIFVVTGSRDGGNWREFVDSVLDRYFDAFGMPDTLAHGDARGVDTLAKEWAERKGITPTPFPADWDTHGTAAGPIRNSEMVNWAVAQRDHQRKVVFIAFPGSKGTADCLRKAKRAGLMIREWRFKNGEAIEVGTPPRKQEPTR